MNESILRALMQLFALVANVHSDRVSNKALTIVESYLKSQFNQDIVDEYLRMFSSFIVEYQVENDTFMEPALRKKASSNTVKVLEICKQVNEGLQQKEKFIVLIRLLEFINEDDVTTADELEFVETVGKTFNIPQNEYENTRDFVLYDINSIHEKHQVLIINNKEALKEKNTDETPVQSETLDVADDFKHLQNIGLASEIHILHLPSIATFAARYKGQRNLYLNGQIMVPQRTYVLNTGAIIKSRKIRPVYYGQIASMFLQPSYKTCVEFVAKDVEFRFHNSNNGIRKFGFTENSGQLIGIMGGSGVGKSTLFNLLNGKIKPNSGKITINGYDIHREKRKLEGVIGYVPQDDLLIEELTVYQNLYYNAKLCFSNFNDEQIEAAVEKILKNLALFDIKDLIVGNPLKKVISGGQRKRLNIAMELMREPAILFVDEPTSGLSSMDSEMVMLLLKELTVKGKMVFVNIHQPSSEIYKLFNRLIIIDKGGHVIYDGNPIDALVYFKTASNYVNANEGECPTCGNVNPEQVLQIVESKVVNEFGEYTQERKFTPEEWYARYVKIKNEEEKLEHEPEKKELPVNYFKIPDSIRQLKIFFMRDLKAKFTNRQYVLITFLEAPLLAIVLGFFTKFISGSELSPDDYIFSENKNLPAFQFMSVVVALFLGLIVSAEEIIRDRKILERESFLNLSRFAYLNSKILLMFGFSAVQMFLFVLVGSFILEIRGLMFNYWIVLFTTSCLANLIGLNISSGFNSVVTIYILVPFVLVPQLLLSGVIVRFDDLHKKLTSQEFVPIIGDLMASRWAFEALAVTQFKDNKYQKHFYKYDRDISRAKYINSYLIPELKSKIIEIEKSTYRNSNRTQNLYLLRNEFIKLNIRDNGLIFNDIENFHPERFDIETSHSALLFLDDIQKHYLLKQRSFKYSRDSVSKALRKKLGSTVTYTKLKRDYHNEQLANWLLNRFSLEKYIEYRGNIIQKVEPVYQQSLSNFGRAHFYAGEKVLLGKNIDTLYFNLAFLWFISLILYIMLLDDVIRKAIVGIENMQLRRTSIYISAKDLKKMKK